MEAVWQKFQAWLAGKGGFAKAVAGLYVAVVALYGFVPAFATLLNSIYDVFPAWAHEVILAAIGVAAYFSNTDTPAKIVARSRAIMSLAKPPSEAEIAAVKGGK